MFHRMFHDTWHESLLISSLHSCVLPFDRPIAVTTNLAGSPPSIVRVLLCQSCTLVAIPANLVSAAAPSAALRHRARLANHACTHHPPISRSTNADSAHFPADLTLIRYPLFASEKSGRMCAKRENMRVLMFCAHFARRKVVCN